MKTFDFVYRHFILPGIGLAALGVLVVTIVKDWRQFWNDFNKAGNWKI